MIADLKPYPAYKDSGVEWLGDVPKRWDTLPLKHWVTINAEVLPETTDPDRVFRYVDIGSVGTGSLTQKPQRLLFARAPSRARRIAHNGDTLVSTVRTYLKAIYFVQGEADEIVCSTGFAVLTPRVGTVPQFVSYLVRSNAFTDRVTADSVGTAYPAIAESRLGSFHVPSPPLPEQTAIVRFLDHYDRRIRRYIRAKQKLITPLEEQREAATHDALRLAGSRSLRIGSAVDRVERLISRQDGHVYTPIGLYNRGRGIFHKPATRGSDLGDSTFFWIAEGDLVLSGQFAWEGAVALAGEEDDGCVASYRYPVLRGKPDLVDSAYLLSFFRTGWGQLLLDHHSRGAAGRNRPLNAASLMKERVTVPPLAVQKQIGALVRREYRLQQALAELADLLREYRTRLIADVVTGKLDVRESAAQLPDEVEEQELLDETDALIDGDEEPADDLDTTPEEATV